MRFVNKSVIITGGNGGIGLATARLLQAQGARLGITGRNAEKLDHALRLLGSEAIGVQIENLSALEHGFAALAQNHSAVASGELQQQHRPEPRS